VDVKKRLPKSGLKGKSAYKPSVPAVEQASRVLLCLGESPNFKMKLTEICKQVGIHKSKGHSILNTLKQFGFVEKDPQAKTYLTTFRTSWTSLMLRTSWTNVL